ncbi:hypothetical protein [Alkalibacillus haloalkaliphilus]|uniref:hypothetical protein n=1 Tax=Alkalibacillus haloalkaliphilus TaxID=94136 RepID=UPI0002DED46D|nr:hypothetical protein [Alkalibacillus haloalkaliphilus]
MDSVNWIDFITPTSFSSAVMIGIIFVLILMFIVWIQVKKIKFIISLFITGTITVIVLAFLLDWLGYYDWMSL